MEKKDLKSGMVVEYRNGQLRMIVGSKLFDKDGNRMYELKIMMNIYVVVLKIMIL